MKTAELIERVRRAVEGLEEAGRFDDRQLLELIRLVGPAGAESLVRVIAIELVARIADRERDGG